MSITRKLPFRLVTLLILMTFLTAAFAAALPAPVQAANQCAAIHVAKANETLKSIAKIYGVNARILAKYNDMSVTDPVSKGDKLCIPKSGRGEPNLNLGITAKGGKLFITSSNMTREDKYLVKVREGDFGPWFNLGKFGSGVKGTVKQTSYPLPSKLLGKLYLTVCLKNQNTDALTCRVVVNVP